MGQLENETTQDDLEGSATPLGLSRSTSTNQHEGIWTPVIRKGVAFTLGGIALAAIGAISMAHQAGRTPALPHLTAAVPGIEPLEWLALSNTPTESADNRDTSTSEEPTQGTGDTSVAPAPPTHTAAPTAPSAVQGPGQGGILPDGRVVLNLATAADLQTLSGIGQKRAESILALRERLGGFKKLSDLLRVKGIGVKSLRKLEPKVTLNPPAPHTPPPAPSLSGANPSKPPNDSER